MKSKISLFNKAIAKRSLTGNIGLWVGILFVWMMALPFFTYVRLKDFLRYADLNEIAPANLAFQKAHTMIEGLWDDRHSFVLVIAFLALLSAMNAFSYLFQSRNANMMHTFPVNRISLFCTNYLTGWLYQTVPVCAGVLFSLLAGASMGAAMDNAVMQYMLWLGAAVIEITFFYSLSVCVLMFSGNFFAVPVFYGILNFLYAGCMIMAEAMVDSVCYGVQAGVIEGAFDHVLTPISYLQRNVYASSTGSVSEMAGTYVVHGGKALAGYLVAALVLTVIAVIAYQKKHLETAGDVITVNWLKPVFRWGAAVCSCTLGAMFFTNVMYQSSFLAVLLYGLGVGTAVFFIAQMLIERTMRVFTKKRMAECAVFIACMSAAYLGLDADMLGLEKKVPDAADIKNVMMNGDVVLYGASEDEIAWVQDIHRQIIASKKEFEQIQDNITFYVSIRYQLKDGNTLNRSYDIPMDDADSKSVFVQIRKYMDRPDVAAKYYFGIHYPDIEVTGAYLQDYSSINLKEKRIPEEDAKRLYQAAVKDINAGNISLYNSRKDPDLQAAAADTEETISMYCYFDVYDKQGFITPQNLYYGNLSRDKTAKTYEISVSSRCKNMRKELQRMGYIEKE